MPDALEGVRRRLTEGAAAAATLTPAWRNRELRRLLRTEVHAGLMRLTTDDAGLKAGELADLAAAVREAVPVGVEDRLPTRQRVLVRLLRRGALEPAATLAHDDASGVLRPARIASMWAGGSYLSTPLALPTLIEAGRVFAWLPGFRDPRHGVPDEVYDITAGAVLRGALHAVELAGGSLMLAGALYLRTLSARPDDEITIVLAGPDGAERRVRATRLRSPEHVRATGPNLTRLAWAGFRVVVDLALLAGTPGSWQLFVELDQEGLARVEPLGQRRGPLAETAARSAPTEAAGCWFHLQEASDGALAVRVGRLGASARLLPRSLRAGLRRVIPRR